MRVRATAPPARNVVAMAEETSARQDRADDVKWWHTAVIYQVYPRSFADANGDGIGDLPGITSRLDHVAALGADAVWLSPFYRSPQRDAGYDVSDHCDVDPLFGTLADFDALVARAHELGLRVIVDVVPNHSSSEHRWFQEALAAGPGSPERARYIFREGRGDGSLPPNNWESVFGGPAWTRVTEADGRPGQWYLHLFDSSQPDFDWTNPEVEAHFEDVLRFWLERGADGFRIDVAHGLVKADGLPDWHPAGVAATSASAPEDDGIVHVEASMSSMGPMWAQEGVHDIWRRWRSLVSSYGEDRVLVAEAWVEPLADTAKWVRPDELHQAFNFPFLMTRWDADALRAVIDESLAVFGAVGAPATWVLSNHDVIRHPTRLALPVPIPHGDGIGPTTPQRPDPAVAWRRGRAATLLMLALPGSAYLYQGEELGLPEVIELPDEARQDPTFRRTHGEKYGRDGCRVPLPWDSDAPAFGFSPTGASWLPQPAEWGAHAASAQDGVPGSSLELYRAALRLRRELRIAHGELTWLEAPPGVLRFRVGAVEVVANVAGEAVSVGGREVLLRSVGSGPVLERDAAAWLTAE